MRTTPLFGMANTATVYPPLSPPPAAKGPSSCCFSVGPSVGSQGDRPTAVRTFVGHFYQFAIYVIARAATVLRRIVFCLFAAYWLASLFYRRRLRHPLARVPRPIETVRFPICLFLLFV